MGEQTALASAADDLRVQLDYFEHVAPIMHVRFFSDDLDDHILPAQKLTSSRMSVTSEAFMHILSTIDRCLAFLDEHADYREAAATAEKYHQCLSRALSLVRQFVAEKLTATRAEEVPD